MTKYMVIDLNTQLPKAVDADNAIMAVVALNQEYMPQDLEIACGPRRPAQWDVFPIYDDCEDVATFSIRERWS